MRAAPVNDDRRKHPRIGQQFIANLSEPDMHESIVGVTDNIGQGGAFIKTDKWTAFQIQDLKIITFFVPPAFSGQNEAIVLQGSGIVKRIESERKGVAVQFDKPLKLFERSDKPEMPATDLL
ncbi:MAG: PilZ domain-containing protein [Thermoplasmata archaeon]